MEGGGGGGGGVLQFSEPFVHAAAVVENVKDLKKLVDDYYKLDYEDVIGDMPVRFKYRKVTPNTFGMSVEQILAAEDRELNQRVSIKKMAPYREQVRHFFFFFFFFFFEAQFFVADWVVRGRGGARGRGASHSNDRGGFRGGRGGGSGDRGRGGFNRGRGGPSRGRGGSR